MPTQDPYAGLGAEEFTEPMWKEFVASHRPSGENIFSKRSGEAALVGFVPSACLEAAMRFMLGYNQVTNSAPFVLMRKNPIRHPRYGQLWCDGVSEQEFKPDSSSRAAIKKMSLAVRTLTPPALQYRAGYKWAKLMVRFRPNQGWKYREDVDPDYPDLSANREEYRRNVVIDMEPRTETFEQKVQYVFAEGEGIPQPGPPFYSNPKGSPVLAENAQILVKPDVVIKWLDVPEAWIMKSNTSLPENILYCLGCVNGDGEDNFLGFRHGTLLLCGAKLTRSPWTLKPRPGLPGSGLESEFTYDVELLMSYFDPPKGSTGAGGPPPTAVQITTNRGHNCFPWPGVREVKVLGVTVPVSDQQSTLWFYATTDGTVGGYPLYSYVPFSRAFDCPQNFP